MKKLLYLILLFPGLLWADSKVSDLNETVTPGATDYLYIVKNSTSMKVQLTNVLGSGSTAYLAASASSTFTGEFLQVSSFTAYTSSVSASYTALSTFTAFASSMPVSYLGIATTTVNAWSASTITASTTLVIPTGANIDISATGETGLDTTSDQLVIHNGSTVMTLAQATHTWTVSMSSGIGFYGSTIAVACAPPNSGITLTSIDASSLPSGTTVQWKLEERGFGTGASSGSNVFSPSISTANATAVTTTNFNDSSIAARACLYTIFTDTDTSKGSPIAFRATINWIYQRQ